MGHGFFGFSPPDAARCSNIFTNLHRRDSCLTVNKIWVFHPGGGGGGYTPSCYAQTHLYLFPLVSKPFDSFGLCPITRVHQSVPVTPNPVPIRTMHSHPCHAMSSCTCNAIMLHIHNHPCTHIHAYYPCFIFKIEHAC